MVDLLDLHNNAVTDLSHELATLLDLLKLHHLTLGYHLAESCLTRFLIRDEPTRAVCVTLRILIQDIVQLIQVLSVAYFKKIFVREHKE